MKKQFYYNPKTMRLSKWGYPVYKNSNLFVHKYVAEKYILKRKLKEGEIVHHVNGDKLDYKLNNLVVLSKEDHWKIEQQIRKQKNLKIAYELILFLIMILIGAFNRLNETRVKIIIWVLLMIGMIIPYTPKILRKSLFRLGILRKNKK